MKRNEFKQITNLRSHFHHIIFLLTVVYMMLTGLCFLLLLRGGRLYFFLRNPLALILAFYVFSFIIATVLTLYISRYILSPVEHLSDASKKVAHGDFTVQIPLDSDSDELNVTISNFNSMVRELRSIETLRDDFIANVSHEFKTPLSAIEGYAMLLQEKNLGDKEREECARKILQSTARLNDLTGNILLLSKLDNQNYPQENTTFSLDEQIRQAILMFESVWTKKQIDIDCDMPDVSFVGPQSLLNHVWINLIGNAVKFVKGDGSGRITVRLTPSEKNVVVTVADNGIGMDDKTIAHIFEKFYQGDTSRRSSGNGLGLALCKKIVESLHGTITAKGAPGEGSVFTVVLPRVPAPPVLSGGMHGEHGEKNVKSEKKRKEK
ncbi:MAG: HAMP domain-containing histidine kinase [Clostridiales bacterium]|nr:HAMP domain-containing histidine kinase [Clostridiales bacterium]